MQRSILWSALLVLVIYLTLVFCAETENGSETQIPENETLLSEARELLEVEGRTRRRHGFHRWGWHALAIAYWIKVKVVIVSFFVGSAVFLGLRYFWPHRCTPEIVYDHPPSYSHDHIPYSLDHSDHIHDHIHDHSSYEPSSFEPYSGYSSYSSSSDIISSDPDPTGPSDIHRIGRRNVDDESGAEDESTVEDESAAELNKDTDAAREIKTEEQIAEFMFMFLGLDSKACRRRFICEMEFRSKHNPITSMAFRIVGHGFFEKYTNALNPHGRATKYLECAEVNPECVFIEQNAGQENEVEEQTEEPANQHTVAEDQQNELDSDLDSQQNDATEETKLEAENVQNLKAEKSNLRRRRGDRKLSTIAEHILTQIQ